MIETRKTWMLLALVAALAAGCGTVREVNPKIGRALGSFDRAPPETRVFPESWGGWVHGEARYVVESDVDDGGDVETTSFFGNVRLDGPVGWRATWLMTQFTHQRVSYDWSGEPELIPGESDPFDDARYTSLDAWIFQALSMETVVAVLLRASSSTESGADWDDGFGWVAGGGVGHVFSDVLVAGFGLVVIRTFDEETLVFPAVQGSWDFAEDWELRLLGPELTVRHPLSDKWEVWGGARIASGRFLLDDQNGSDGEAASDFSIPIFVAANYGVSDRLEIEGRVGMLVSREITFDVDGDDEEDFDVDPSAFLTLSLRWWF